MTLIVLASASGAPGVSVTALGLALAWSRDVTLVDADANPSQSLLAGYLRGRAAHGPGLLGVAQAHRELGDLAGAVVEHRIPLPVPPAREPLAEVARHFLPGFAHLQAVDSFAGVWGPFARALRGASFDSIVDAGRLGRHGLPEALVEAAHQVAVVTRTSLPALAALRLYLPPLVEQAGVGSVGLVLIGPGRPYEAGEIADQFGVPVLAEIDWQPTAATDLAEGHRLSTKWSAQPLARSYARAAKAFAVFDESLPIDEPVGVGA